MFWSSTVCPLPSAGVTGFGLYVMGVAPPASVPRTIGLLGSSVSARVESVTTPLKAWFRDTLIEPARATVPVVGRGAIVAGWVIVKSGIDMTFPG
jgi:hypothetical protein